MMHGNSNSISAEFETLGDLMEFVILYREDIVHRATTHGDTTSANLLFAWAMVFDITSKCFPGEHDLLVQALAQYLLECIEQYKRTTGYEG